MKERILKIGVVLFLVAALVVAVVYPITSQAAAKGTTYNVVLQKGSPIVSLVSLNGSTAAAELAQQDGVSFQIVVGSKLNTEKVKSTGGKASYYDVTIIAKSYKAGTQQFPMIGGGGMATQSSFMPKDGKGKLYTSGGDVDVAVTLGKKMVEKIGDGTADPAGSMIIPNVTVTSIITVSGKVVMTQPVTQTMTTGQSSIVVSGSKTKLDGKKLPENDTTKSLTNPLVGKPVDLNAGTGTLVSTDGVIGNKSKMLGTTDLMGGQVWVMKLTKQ